MPWGRLSKRGLINYVQRERDIRGPRKKKIWEGTFRDVQDRGSWYFQKEG
jgi:hypothetical protein